MVFTGQIFKQNYKFLDGNPDGTCYYQGTCETMVNTSLINIGEDIMRETMVTHTQEAAEVASEDEDTKASEVALTKNLYLHDCTFL